MAHQFDSRGFLKPYNCCKISLLEFEAFFVNSFENNESRRRIFESYKAYLDAFANEISPKFTQWLDGSFLTKKQMPRDLDFVTLLDFQVANDKRDLLRSKFLRTPAFGFFGLDA